MKRNTGNIALICGGAAVILAMFVMLWFILPGSSRQSSPEATEGGRTTDITIGTYGENAYLYSFDHESLEFTLKSVGGAKNASYALSRRGEKNSTLTYAVRESGEESGLASFVSKDRALSKGATAMKNTAYMGQTGADPCFLMAYDDWKYR